MTDLAAETRLLGGGLESLPKVNLLPPEIAERARFRRVQSGLAGALVLALAGTGLLYLSATGAVGDAETTLASAEQTESSLQREKAQFADVTAVYARAAAAQQMLVQAMGSEVRYSRFLNDMSLSIPEGVWLTDVTFAQTPDDGTGTIGTVSFTGIAFEHDQVANWLDALSRQSGFAVPYLDSSESTLIGQRPTVEWSTSVVLTPQALSNRYTQTGS